jgi:hypothetical protein
MGQEPAESGQSPAESGQSPATSGAKSTPNGSSPGSGHEETVNDSPVTTVERGAEPELGQPGGLDGPPLAGPVDDQPGDEEDMAPQGLLEADDISKPVQVPLSTARYRIATAAMAILGFVVIATFVSLWREKASIDDLTRVLEIIFAPIIALVGVALAFYYRSTP